MFFFFCQKRATLGFENFFFAANVSNIKLSFVPWNEEMQFVAYLVLSIGMKECKFLERVAFLLKITFGRDCEFGVEKNRQFVCACRSNSWNVLFFCEDYFLTSRGEFASRKMIEMIDFVIMMSENYRYLAAHPTGQIYSPHTEFYYRQVELLCT